MPVSPSQAGPDLGPIPRPPRRPSPKVPSLGPSSAGTAPVSPKEVSEIPPQLPRPQLRPGRLQQLQESLSLRLGSLDPGWLQRCHNGTLDFLGTSKVCQPVLGTEEPQPLTLGVPSVLGPSTGPEAPLQGPEAPTLVVAGVSAGSPLLGSSQGKKQRRSAEPKGTSAQIQQHSDEAGAPLEGARAGVHAKDCPGEPMQSQPLTSPPAPR